MVGRWGMSDAIGPVAVVEGRHDGVLLPGVEVPSPMTQQMVDEETRRIIERAETEVVELLTRERSRLEALAHALLERETLDQEEAYRVASIEPEPFDLEREAKAATSLNKEGAADV
jgi:cell division protease FtsH